MHVSGADQRAALHTRFFFFLSIPKTKHNLFIITDEKTIHVPSVTMVTCIPVSLSTRMLSVLVRTRHQCVLQSPL